MHGGARDPLYRDRRNQARVFHHRPVGKRADDFEMGVMHVLNRAYIVTKHARNGFQTGTRPAETFVVQAVPLSSTYLRSVDAGALHGGVVRYQTRIADLPRHRGS